MFDFSLVATAPVAATVASTSCPGVEAVNPLCYAVGAIGSIGGIRGHGRRGRRARRPESMGGQWCRVVALPNRQRAHQHHDDRPRSGLVPDPLRGDDRPGCGRRAAAPPGVDIAGCLPAERGPVDQGVLRPTSPRSPPRGRRHPDRDPLPFGDRCHVHRGGRWIRFRRQCAPGRHDQRVGDRCRGPHHGHVRASVGRPPRRGGGVRAVARASRAPRPRSMSPCSSSRWPWPRWCGPPCRTGAAVSSRRWQP